MPDGGAQARRDDRSFEEFVAERGTALLRTAVYLAGDRQAGEDLLQDVLLRAYGRWVKVDEPEAYTRRALVNAATNRRRGYRRSREDLVDLSDSPVERPTLPGGRGDLAGVVGDRHDLLGALRQLPPRQRAVIVLRYFDDLTEAEIAAQLGCRPGSVKTHAARGMSRLRELLGASTVADRMGGVVGPDQVREASA
ncbi:SigE family RNA polymerase sigma factor [Pseudofrankia inefficax]|uniref:RNA polymerase, sigma-24 subunit, ECF subfamily n=1 Tax=Pseudofrankia inefficax (strain DSM 45817 / CECT 9037 / DDB 130130 / EuI1c) TaxID=298654 RepID=E3JBA1_PSEI1|nr:SigE family RNA polymerase sigma factor [Pseudofrankia inefficax]ADP78631.1 RNA polymerase, sigma-24 subunit, ECF subfamily [Pseudofrankia inefficax]